MRGISQKWFFGALSLGLCAALGAPSFAQKTALEGPLEAPPEDPLAALKAYLESPETERAPLAEQAFAQAPLPEEDAAKAADILWEHFEKGFDRSPHEIADHSMVAAEGMQMPYMFRVFGDAPEGGHSLFISMHGGGGVGREVNDGQWHNQIELYQPAEGIYLAPRAPRDRWDMWHAAPIDALMTKLISKMVVLHGVNPDRVYLMGYSAGGDGAYQLAPRMADRWAAATAAAGHPNDASPLNLRNIAFSIHVGELDGAYNRNGVAREWQKMLGLLQAADPEGYVHSVNIHQGLGHWMYLRDAVAVPWMAQYTRNPLPQKIVWTQDDVHVNAFYWLRADATLMAGSGKINAELSGQDISLAAPIDLPVKVLLNDRMLDLDKPLTIRTPEGSLLFEGMAKRTILNLATSLSEREDRQLMFSAEVEVTLPALRPPEEDPK